VEERFGQALSAVCSRIAYSDQKRPWCSYLLPAGEGAPQGRMRAELLALARKSPHPAVPATFSPREKERRPRRACNSTVKRAKIGKDQESEASVGVLATSSKEQASIPGSLFIPVESAWPVSCVSRNSAKPAPTMKRPCRSRASATSSVLCEQPGERAIVSGQGSYSVTSGGTWSPILSQAALR